MSSYRFDQEGEPESRDFIVLVKRCWENVLVNEDSAAVLCVQIKNCWLKLQQSN